MSSYGLICPFGNIDLESFSKGKQRVLVSSTRNFVRKANFFAYPYKLKARQIDDNDQSAPEGTNMFAGGIADKLGNRYEAKWLVRQLLDVIGGKAQSLRFEGIDSSFSGFEFALRRSGATEWHQTKINSPNGNWTLNSLKREGVLSAFKERLNSNESDICAFVSQDPAKDIAVLSQKAKVASDWAEFQETLSNDQAEKFKRLKEIWGTDSEKSYSWLQRTTFETVSEASIDSLIETFSILYFRGAAGASFEVLREFLESRFNKLITTESARSELRAEGKLILDDPSIDPTLKERISSATKVYLETYTPFGAGGSKISRPEASKLAEQITEPNGANVFLLTGVAGSGKSGVLREFIEILTKRDIPHVAFRIDQHLDCTSPAQLGKAITGREETPAATLKRTFPDQPSVLIVDQVDAVSEASGRNGIVKQAVLSLVSDIRNFGNMAIVIACRTFDLESDQRLKALKDTPHIVHIDVQLLSWEEDVKPLLIKNTISVDLPSEKQRTLLCLPLNLAIFLEVYSGTYPEFSSRNDLFARLLEKKGRSIRVDRQLTWDIESPLKKLAEWMSDRQKLDAPEGIISEFGGATDILASEGLIVRSRSSLNFFHESFFDYIYARTFAGREKTLESLLTESEQHLFRRTQVRQILETLRQTDLPRYHRELRTVLHSEGVRYHVKVAVAQWLGSLTAPTREEKEIVLHLDNETESLVLLIRCAFLSSTGWFDRLLRDGWIQANLGSNRPYLTDNILWWLSDIAGQRPTEVTKLLNNWWADDPARAIKLINWFGFAKRQKPDDSLVDLCRRVILSNPPGLFEGGEPRTPNLLLHRWAAENPSGASKILDAYFDVWFTAHPDHHPFERELFREFDEHSFREMAQKSPAAFVEGSISAFRRSIELITMKDAAGEGDYSFRIRHSSGHNFAEDAFLEMFRTSMRHIASVDPEAAERFLRSIDPNKHEVCAHIWLETIAANGPALSSIFPEALESPHLFEAGWHGADWKSFADAARATIPFLTRPALSALYALILRHQPELRFASQLLGAIQDTGEQIPFQTRESVLHYISRSGYEQWCILETIGDALLAPNLKLLLQQLRRKFRDTAIEEPEHIRVLSVQSPIEHDRAKLMTDTQWLRAIERYDNDDRRDRGRSWISGGAHELAGELQSLAKEQPARIARLLENIPDTANKAYVRHMLWGLAEADDLPDDIAKAAILNAHARPDHPYGADIARLVAKFPHIATEAAIFNALAWYIEWGDANCDDAVDSSNAEREVTSVEDLLNRSGGLRIRGINGARAWAAEALASVIWHVPETKDAAWTLLEGRANKEPLLSVRCCLLQPAIPLFNDDRERCAALLERLSRAPHDFNFRSPSAAEQVWIWLAFPANSLPQPLKKATIWSARLLEQLLRRIRPNHQATEGAKWVAPLLTHHGVYLLPFLLHSVPDVGQRLLYRLIVAGDDTARMIGTWHVFREAFQDDRYAALADACAKDGTIYRRLLANLASQVMTIDEYRYRAERTLVSSFDDSDKQVRSQASEAFREIKPNEFGRYRDLATSYVASKAFETNSWAFFHALEEAECKVDDIVISATEKLIDEIERDGNEAGRRSMDLHQLQDILKREYASSEADPDLRRRLLDLIDRMIELDLYGVEGIVKAHER